MPDLTQPAGWLPLVFLALMGVAMMAYVILDGFDLGVGILLRRAGDADKDTMIASIGPFWDANETWLVLGVGILLVAFPMAHGAILGELYLPVALMLVLNAMEPQAMALLWHSRVGWATLVVLALLEIMGIYVIRRIITIDV